MRCRSSLRFHADLKLTEAQVASLRATHLPSALQDCVQAVVMAAGHSSVIAALSRLNIYLMIDAMSAPYTATHQCRETLHPLNWQAAVTRCKHTLQPPKLNTIRDGTKLNVLMAQKGNFFFSNSAQHSDMLIKALKGRYD